jgi:glycogen synthase
MKICHICINFLPTSTGGVEQYIINIARNLKELGVSSLLLIPRIDPLHSTENLDYLKLFRLEFLHTPYQLLRAYRSKESLELNYRRSHFAILATILYQSYKEFIDFPLSGYFWLLRKYVVRGR